METEHWERVVSPRHLVKGTTSTESTKLPPRQVPSLGEAEHDPFLRFTL